MTTFLLGKAITYHFYHHDTVPRNYWNKLTLYPEYHGKFATDATNNHADVPCFKICSFKIKKNGYLTSVLSEWEQWELQKQKSRNEFSLEHKPVSNEEHIKEMPMFLW